MNKSYWEKRFSLGLVLDTDLEEFDAFLSKYHPYIDNFYFSLPMGERFHSRRKVAEQFQRGEVIEQFWQQLHMIHDYGIRLEVLFNTHGVDERDVEAGRDMLLAHGIHPEKVGLVDEAYEAAVKAFPGAETVYSFNNSPSGLSSYDAGGHRYAEYVAGRQFIRDEALWDHIHQDLHGRVVLLVNNGCSHICGGCASLRHCLDAYQKALTMHSAEYIYALQSIMPYELHENWIDREKIDLIKINSRNTNLSYLRDSLESYIQGDEARWIGQSKGNYALWAHLTWHIRWFGTFDLERIRAIKTSFYRGETVPDVPQGPFVPVMVDYTNRFIFKNSKDAQPNEEDKKQVLDFLHEVGGRITAYCVGAEGCPHLLDAIELKRLKDLLEELRKQECRIYFSIPRGCTLRRADALLDELAGCGIQINGLILRDMALMEHFRERKDLTLFAGAELASQPEWDQEKARECGSVYDFQSEHIPEHLRTSRTVARTPLTYLCDGICCLKQKADQEDGCEHTPCLDSSARLLRGNLPGLRRMRIRADQLYRVITPTDAAFVTTQTYCMTIQYIPEER